QGTDHLASITALRAVDSTVLARYPDFIPMAIDSSMRSITGLDVRAGPNPARDVFSIRFRALDARPARLDLFDLRGRRVATRDLAPQAAGVQETRIALPDATPGLYFA